MKILIYADLTDSWYWELRGADGLAVAISSVSYKSRGEVLNAISDLRIVFRHVPVMDLAGNYFEDD